MAGAHSASPIIHNIEESLKIFAVISRDDKNSILIVLFHLVLSLVCSVLDVPFR